MKDSKLSKEITQLNFILVIIYFIVIFGATIFIQNFYVDFKLTMLQNFFEENQETLTEDSLIDYAIEQGFTYTIKTKIDVQAEIYEALTNPNENAKQYSNLLNFFNDLDPNTEYNSKYKLSTRVDNQTKSVAFSTPENIVTLSLNPSITKDIVFITMSIAIFTTLIFLIMILSVNAFINKRVGRPLDKISKYIDDIASLNHTNELTFKHDDEIAKIAGALVDMEKNLNREIINRNELLRAITHELKTPLAHIVTLLYLHKSKVDQYEDFEHVEQLILEIINENNELIQITLNSLGNTDSLKEQFNIETFITKKIKIFDIYLNGKETTLNLQPFEFKANPVPLNLVINNLLLNAAKYSQTFISIENDGPNIVITNDYQKQHASGVGKTIISRLSEFEGYEIDTLQQDNLYITKVSLDNCGK